MAAVCSPKTEEIITQQWIELSHRNLVCDYISTLLDELPFAFDNFYFFLNDADDDVFISFDKAQRGHQSVLHQSFHEMNS